MRKKKKIGILFLSALDFKEKSIQVIRKTPEAYAKRGFEVFYVVARDTSKYGDYYYEKIINPPGIHIIRFEWPLKKIRDFFGKSKIGVILSKIASYLVILKLAYYGSKILKKERNIKVVYGYEIHGVLAANILKLFGLLNGKVLVHRFQGTWLTYYLKNKKFLKLLFNWEHLFALWLKSDLCIMTDDGTQGEEALKKINSKSLHNLKFWVNGVDEIKLPQNLILQLKRKYGVEGKWIFLTVCRLVKWKRVDRALKIFSILKNKYGFNNFIYFIVGEGPQKKELQKLAEKLDIKDNVIFVGAVPHSKVVEFLNMADFVILTYDLTNVGNPLLEAIRANKIIFTLNNGDTGKWIKHKFNGFIYDINKNMYEQIAKDIMEVIHNKKLREYVILNIKKTEKEKLWTWEERLTKEIDEVLKLIKHET